MTSTDKYDLQTQFLTDTMFSIKSATVDIKTVLPNEQTQTGKTILS
jgi:hypothetical protein